MEATPRKPAAIRLPAIHHENYPIRQTKHAGHCWRSKDELISDILLQTPSHGQAKAGWPARTYIQRLCADTGFSLEDLPGAMNDRYRWQERVGDPCWLHDMMIMMNSVKWNAAWGAGMTKNMIAVKMGCSQSAVSKKRHFFKMVWLQFKNQDNS